MTDDDNGWKLFASTGKISDYLKYRENTLMATTATAAENGKTQEKERYERDLYGDGHGFVSDASGRI